MGLGMCAAVFRISVLSAIFCFVTCTPGNTLIITVSGHPTENVHDDHHGTFTVIPKTAVWLNCSIPIPISKDRIAYWNPTTKYEKNVLKQDSKINTEVYDVLRISNASPDNNGIYTCFDNKGSSRSINIKVEALCGPPPAVTHSRIVAPSDTSKFEIDSVVEYSCISGYEVEGFTLAKCSLYRGTAQWFGPNHRCNSGCKTEALLGFRGLILSCQSSLDEGEWLQPICSEGFEFSNKNDTRIYCLNGNWTGNLPPCSPACLHSQFRCNDGQCISIEQRCDRNYDCRDGSDEQDCSPVQCNPVGSLTPEPSRTTGLCQCKPYVTGARCDECKTHTFHLNPGSPLGCIDCFCMGITKACTSCSWYRDEVSLSFTHSPQGVVLTNILRSSNINQNLQVDSRNRELVFRNFASQPIQTYYWKLPPPFLGDKVTTYGGTLNYTVMYVPGSRADPNLDPDAEIMGNSIVLMYRHPELIRPGVRHAVSIPMYETSWLGADGQPATREHLLMTLADLDDILIKATYTGETTSASLADISLTIAVDQPTGRERALSVEQCRCPIGYTGLSCEDCDAGYTRSGAGLYLGLCEPCFCNSHSSDCDPETGICRNCQHNTGGDFCEECLPGFVGDASSGTPNDCRPAVRENN